MLLNISGANNRALKEACRVLKDYAVYTDKIRIYTEEMPLEEVEPRHPGVHPGRRAERVPRGSQVGGERDEYI